jgi:predicted phage tail protein
MRRSSFAVSGVIALVGALLMIASFFVWGTPWCATNEACSQPNVVWSPLLFLLGVALLFGSAINYSVLGPRDRD